MSHPYLYLGETWGRGIGLRLFNLFLSLVGPIYIYFSKEIKLITYTYKTTTVAVFIIFYTYIRVIYTCSYTISLLQNFTFTYKNKYETYLGWASIAVLAFADVECCECPI